MRVILTNRNARALAHLIHAHPDAEVLLDSTSPDAWAIHVGDVDTVEVRAVRPTPSAPGAFVVEDMDGCAVIRADARTEELG